MALLVARAAQAAPPDLEGTRPRELEGKTPVADVDLQCFSCHAGTVDEAGNAFRPWDTWAGTMMANAVRDPLFLAALTVAEQDRKDIGTFCLRCHTPSGFVRGHATPGLGSGLVGDDLQGVSCEACHRSIDPSSTAPPIDPKGPYVGNGRLFWETTAKKHGPYDDSAPPESAHLAVGDRFGSSALLCGQCHELTNPLVTMRDASGKDTGIPFPLDTTFTEWSTSTYGKAGPEAKTCQECHMPRAKGALKVSTFPTALPRTDPRTHLFMGGNAWGIEAVKAANPDLAKDRAQAFDAAQRAALTMLASAVKVEIVEAPGTVATRDPIDVKVRVTNLAGHKFPTGYADGRLAFLRIELLDGRGVALSTIGSYDEAKQELVADPQLRVYQVLHEERAGGKSLEWHIARHDTVVRDTRLPPKGFVPGPTTAIIGADYGDGAGGTRPWDEAVFHLRTNEPLSSPALTIRATVLYQATQRAFVDELVNANTTDGRGKALRAAWEATGRAPPRAIASAEARLSVTGLPSPDAATAGCSCSTLPDGVALGAAGGKGALLLAAAAWACRAGRQRYRPLGAAISRRGRR